MAPREGGCRCGQVLFCISAGPLVTNACHCTGCRRMTASAFSLSVAIPSGRFELIAGEPILGGLHRPEQRHFHCPHCLSWVFTRIGGMDQFVNVRATMLDEPGDWATPFVETFTGEKLSWATTPARHSYATIPPNEVWEGLIAEYRGKPTRE